MTARSLRWFAGLLGVLALVTAAGLSPWLRVETLAQVYGGTPVAPAPSTAVLPAVVTPAPSAAPVTATIPSVAPAAPEAPISPPAAPATAEAPRTEVLSTSVAPAPSAAMAPAAPAAPAAGAMGVAAAGGQLPVALPHAGTGGFTSGSSDTPFGVVSMLGLALALVALTATAWSARRTQSHASDRP